MKNIRLIITIIAVVVFAIPSLAQTSLSKLVGRLENDKDSSNQVHIEKRDPNSKDLLYFVVNMVIPGRQAETVIQAFEKERSKATEYSVSKGHYYIIKFVKSNQIHTFTLTRHGRSWNLTEQLKPSSGYRPMNFDPITITVPDEEFFNIEI